MIARMATVKFKCNNTNGEKQMAHLNPFLETKESENQIALLPLGENKSLVECLSLTAAEPQMAKPNNKKKKWVIGKMEDFQIDGKRKAEINCLEYCLQDIKNTTEVICCLTAERLPRQVAVIQSQYTLVKQLFNELRKILLNNPNIKKLIFKENAKPDGVLINFLPKDWEELFYELLEETGVESVELRNMAPLKADYNETGMYFDASKNSHRDFLQFIQKLYLLGIRELDFGNTIIFRSLPSSVRMEKLMSRSGYFETCSICECMTTLFCCPMVACMLCYCNCFAPAYLDQEQNNNKFVKLDADFLSTLAYYARDYHSFSMDMSKMLQHMFRVKAKCPDGHPSYLHTEPLNLRKFIEHLKYAKWRKLHIRGFQIDYLDPKTKMELLNVFFNLKNLKVLSLLDCSLFEKSDEAQINQIANLIANSKLKVLTGLGVNKISFDHFKSFIQIILRRSKHLRVLDLSDIYQYTDKDLDSYKKTHGFIDLNINKRRVRILGSDKMIQNYKENFLEMLSLYIPNLETLDLSNTGLFTIARAGIEEETLWRENLKKLAELINNSQVTRLFLVRNFDMEKIECTFETFHGRLSCFINLLKDNKQLIETDNEGDMSNFNPIDVAESDENYFQFIETIAILRTIIKDNNERSITVALKATPGFEAGLKPFIPLVLQYLNFRKPYREGSIKFEDQKDLSNRVKASDMSEYVHSEPESKRGGRMQTNN